MKIPEPLFNIINPFMTLLLRSPLHFLMSGSLMLITFTGKRTGRSYTTPVRYVRDGDMVRCFTSRTTRWWPNLADDAEVTLTIQGGERRYRSNVIVADSQRIEKELRAYLALYPQDAAYHEIRLNSDRTLNAEDLARAVGEAVVVEAVPT